MSFKIFVSNFKGTGYDVLSFKKDRISFGRNPENDLVLKDGDVSRKHASIYREGEKFYIEDHNSLNGTHLFIDDHWEEVTGRIEVVMPVIAVLGVNALLKIESFTSDQDDYHDRTRISENPTSVIEGMMEKEKYEAIMVLDLCDSTKIASKNEKLAYQMKLRLNQIAMPILFRDNITFYKGTGDGFLTIFRSSVSALKSALKIVKKINDPKFFQNEKRLNYRIALHYGKTYYSGHPGGDVHGSDINITFRIEGVKTDSFEKLNCQVPLENRILCSRAFYEQVKDTVMIFSLAFIDCGRARLKGIPKLFTIYSIE